MHWLNNTESAAGITPAILPSQVVCTIIDRAAHKPSVQPSETKHPVHSFPKTQTLITHNNK